jgi:hypothetical protein
MTDSDHVLVRTVLLLVKTFAPANIFWIARLAGRSEIAVAHALVKLEREGQAVDQGGLWSLTETGRQRCREAHQTRPEAVSVRRYGVKAR